MSYEVRLRPIAGGRLMVAVYLDGHALATTELVGAFDGARSQADAVMAPPPFNIGNLPLDIPLDHLAPARVGMTVKEALNRADKPVDLFDPMCDHAGGEAWVRVNGAVLRCRRCGATRARTAPEPDEAA